MNDIAFPTWVSDSPSLAMADTLCQLLTREYADVDAQPESKWTGMGDLPSCSNVAAAQPLYIVKNSPDARNLTCGGTTGADRTKKKVDDTPQRNGGDNTDGGATGSNPLRMVDRLIAARTPPMQRPRVPTGYPASGPAQCTTSNHYAGAIHPFLRPEAFPSYHPSAAGLSLAGTPPLTPLTRPIRSGGDILHDTRVQRLLRLSRLNEILGERSAAARPIAVKTAAMIVSFFAFAVSCHFSSIPEDCTRGFFSECGVLYRALLTNMRELSFSADVNVSDFVACIVACGLQLRSTEEQDGNGAAEDGDVGSLAEGSGASTGRRPISPGPNGRVGLAGFGYRATDSILIACIPENIDACVADPVALGALRGFALSHSRRPFLLGSRLVNHLHDLTDAFATSTHRHTLSYKYVLSFLLEAMSYSRVVDYKRSNQWVMAIIQESYVVRGLFQLDVLHANVVSATMTLLIRQYQEMAAECAAMVVDASVMPDFTEGDQLMELMWRALQDTLGAWGEAPTSSSHQHPRTLYRHNIEVVVGRLLQTEVERLRCYYVITSATVAYQESLSQRQIAHVRQTKEAVPAITSPTASGPAAAAPNASGSSSQPYTPSEEEEALRIQICTNIVKFLLSPTSLLNALPSAEEANELCMALTNAAARVLRVVTAMEFASDAAAPSRRGSLRSGPPISSEGNGGRRASHPATPPSQQLQQPLLSSAVLPGSVQSYGVDAERGGPDSARYQMANFSSHFYRSVEHVLHELIETVLQQQDDVGSTATSRAVLRGTMAATCIQHICSANPHLRSFAVSEVMDSIVHLSSRRDATSPRSGTMATSGAGNANNGAKRAAPQNGPLATNGSRSPSTQLFEGEDSRKTAELRREYQLKLCFDLMSSIVVPAHYYCTEGTGALASRGASPASFAPLELIRYGQLLCDTYEDSLREYRCRAAAGEVMKSSLPTPVMFVASGAFEQLVLRLHDRLRSMTQLAMVMLRNDDGAGGGGVYTEKGHSQFLRTFNAEHRSVALLMSGAMRCMLNVAWPGSGILYQNSASSGERPPDGTATPAAMAPTALSCVTPILRSIAILLRLFTIFPVYSLAQLTAHGENAHNMSRFDLDAEDDCTPHYFYRQSRAEVVNVGTPTASPIEQRSRALFRSCWFMLLYYGFTTECLASERASDETPEVGRARLLGGPIKKLIRVIAASATPLLRMCSSDVQQAMADIAVLLQYIRRSGAVKVTSVSGVLHRQQCCSLQQLCGGSKDDWGKLSMGELYLMRAVAELELLRAASGSVALLTTYGHFEVREFVASPAMPQVLSYIISACCEQYVRSVQRMSPSIALQVIERDLIQLVLLLSFAMASVSALAQKMTLMIVTAFPMYAGHTNALPLLWCSLDVLQSGSAEQIAAFCLRARFAEVPAVAADPQSVERQLHLSVVAGVAEQWAVATKAAAPEALFDLAMRFMALQGQECGQYAAVEAGGHLAGSRLAVLASQSKGFVPGVESPATSVGVQAAGGLVCPNYAQSLLLHGEAQGTLRATRWFLSAEKVEATVLAQLCIGMRLGRAATVATVTERLKRELAVARYAVSPRGQSGATTSSHRQIAISVTPSAAPELPASPEETPANEYTVLASAVALLAIGACSPSGHRQLLHYLVQGPIQTFRSDILYEAILCWKWLLAQDREAYLLPLLLEVDAGLAWTATNRLGLFDGYCTSRNTQVQSGDVATASTASDSSTTFTPHAQLFSFLADVYVAVGSPLQLRRDIQHALFQTVFHVLQHVSVFSLKDESFSEMMRCIILLGYACRLMLEEELRRLRNGQQMMLPFAAIGALRQRWYSALLRWFVKMPPSWYFAKDLTAAQEAIQIVSAVVALLTEECASVTQSSLGSVDFKSGVRAERNWVGANSAVRQRVAMCQLAVAEGEVLHGNFIVEEQKHVVELLELLQVLVGHELLRLRVWCAPRRTKELEDSTPKTRWGSYISTAARYHPAVVVAMVHRFSSITEVRKLACRQIAEHPEWYANIPEAVDLYLTADVVATGAPKLYLFCAANIVQALRLLHVRYAACPAITDYAVRSLLSKDSEQLVFYLPQLLQLLATDTTGTIQDFLLRMSSKSVIFAHQLLWCLRTEMEGEGPLAKRCGVLQEKVTSCFTPVQLVFYKNEFAFMDLVTSISGELMKYDKPNRKSQLRLRLQDRCFHDAPSCQHLYLPTDPGYRVVDVISNTAGAMQSAAKCPILVQFKCVTRQRDDMQLPASGGEKGGRDSACAADDGAMQVLPPLPPSTLVKACIFKMGDDCRQDQLSLQLIGLMQRALNAVGVPSFLYPYRVVTTGQGCGIIECVPRAMSRNEIGKLVESNLAEYFVQVFGHPESVDFRQARENFVRSMASYSVVSFILNIKDRHNGNIMIDAAGNLIHIDFGFLFDTSPGGDMNFESSPFKLTTEMVQLIGMDVGSDSKLASSSLAAALVDEENYIYFKTLLNRCYLAVREHAREICILVELMLGSGLPCFKPKKTIADLAERLSIGKTEIQAAHYMRRRIHESRQNFRTVIYDFYQNVAEGIEM